MTYNVEFCVTWVIGVVAFTFLAVVSFGANSGKSKVTLPPGGPEERLTNQQYCKLANCYCCIKEYDNELNCYEIY